MKYNLYILVSKFFRTQIIDNQRIASLKIPETKIFSVYFVYLMLISCTMYACKTKVKPGCVLKEPTNPPKETSISYRFDDEKWPLQTIEGKPINFKSDGGEIPHIQFNTRENKISGYASCNGFGGTYKGEQGRISISKVFATRRACMEDGRNKTEQSYLRILEEVTRYEIQGNKMTFFKGDLTALEFEKK